VGILAKRSATWKVEEEQRENEIEQFISNTENVLLYSIVCAYHLKFCPGLVRFHASFTTSV